MTKREEIISLLEERGYKITERRTHYIVMKLNIFDKKAKSIFHFKQYNQALMDEKIRVLIGEHGAFRMTYTTLARSTDISSKLPTILAEKNTLQDFISIEE